MMKKTLMIFAIATTLILVCLISYLNDMQMNGCLEFRVPKLAKREIIELQSRNFFRNEELTKIKLSKGQMKMILRNIEKNNNWKNTPLDNELNDKIKSHTREGVYNEIPYVENAYWIFTNRSNAVEDKHSIEELTNDKYYAVSLGILDVENNILYYYEYDR